MTIEQAIKELNKYKGLKGKFSSHFSSIVDDVFVSYYDQIKARKDYETKSEQRRLSITDKSDDEFIVWAKN